MDGNGEENPFLKEWFEVIQLKQPRIESRVNLTNLP